jgi:MarR family transcriptional regulator, 2-MHQ and catechol-resistance regulon repressor
LPTHFKGTEETKRALNAFINLARASNSVAARLSAQLEPEGLTVGQFGVLEALLHLGPMCQRTIGEKLLRSGGNITLVLDNLEKHGWARRERQKDDRRMIVIHLTPAGRKLIAHVLPRHARAIVKEMSPLEPSEQEALRRLCRKLGRGGEQLRPKKLIKEKENVTDSTQ